MGLCIFKMYQMTPRQFQNHAEGYLESEKRKHRAKMERLRLLCYYAAAGNLKKGTTPEKLFRFEWERPTISDDDPDDGLTNEQRVQQAREYWAEIDKKRGGPDR